MDYLLLVAAAAILIAVFIGALVSTSKTGSQQNFDSRPAPSSDQPADAAAKTGASSLSNPHAHAAQTQPPPA
jgi:hypothetical protein